jgi:murein L,D-transpeptidase YcbB/YkuD
MSFDIAKTPTLQAVATENEQQLAEDLQQRVDAGLQQADEQPEVIAAAEAQGVAEAHLAKLQRAERALSQFAKDMSDKISVFREAALDGVIESAASGGKPDFKALNQLAAIEIRSRHASRAIERLVEQRIPAAQIARLREESHAALAKSRAIERIAQDRAEKLLGQLRDAVSEEVVLPVDLSKGVSGALLAYAARYKSHAIQISENADQLERGRR